MIDGEILHYMKLSYTLKKLKIKQKLINNNIISLLTEKIDSDNDSE